MILSVHKKNLCETKKMNVGPECYKNFSEIVLHKILRSNCLLSCRFHGQKHYGK